MKRLVILLGLVLLHGCAKDPSKNVVKAKVEAPVAPPVKAGQQESKASKPTPDEPAVAQNPQVADEKPFVPTPVIEEKVDPKNIPSDEEVAAKIANLRTVQLTGKVRFTGSKVTGSNTCDLPKASGTMTLNGKTLGNAALEFEVETGTLKCNEGDRNQWTPKLEKHLLEEDFLHVEKYPRASFISVSIVPNKSAANRYDVAGNLTLRGVTKKITFPATITVTDKAVTGAAEFSINRKDFGMVYNGKADDLIRDGVVLKVDLKGALN